MIQFNLLPDIKIQYIKARRQKRIVLLTSAAVSGACVALLVVLIVTVYVVQRKSLSDVSKDITTASNELQNTQDLTKMLTVQNQLNSLPDLHKKKAVANRLFGFVTQTTPSAASISRLNVNFNAQTMTISGAADSLGTVNTFTDTLKFSTYHTEKDDKKEVLAFSNVVLSNFDRDSKGANYTITLKFDPLIFGEEDEITLTVPKKVTTRSQTEQPSALFQKEGAQ